MSVCPGPTEPTTTYSHHQQDDITALLLGRTVTKVDEDTLRLDDGRVLKLKGNDGGCSCSDGDYDLTELNGTDNVITKVEFDDNPDFDGRFVDEYDEGGYYRIFVYADNKKINLATFSGSDGNGYYGTGYQIEVQVGRG